jgi:hypothetical protein
MPSDSMTTLSDKVRVIFPDGLPGGVDASQVKLMIQRQPEAQQSRDGNGAAAENPTIAAQNKPELVPSDLRPATPPPSQDESHQPLPAGACPATHPPTQVEPEPASADARTPTPPHAQHENASVPLPSASCLLPPPRTRAEAARENGRKSRGPITPEGKARSSQNALKHGLSSRRVVIGTEDEEEWLEFRDECRQTFSPVGAIELGYGDEFAASRWRLNRCLGIETSIFDHEFAMQKIYDEKRCSEMDDLAKTGKAFRSAQDNLSALGRYETRIRRSGERALTNLLKLQSLRQNEPDELDPQNSCKADSLVREPAPQPVQPSESSASVLQNKPEIPPAPAGLTGPPTTQSAAADVLQDKPKQPAVLDDPTEPTKTQAPPAAVDTQNEPNEPTPNPKPPATSYGLKPESSTVVSSEIGSSPLRTTRSTATGSL